MLGDRRISTRAEQREVAMAQTQTEDRLDRHGPHGLPHGRAPAQGRLRRLDLEPHRAPRPSRWPRSAPRWSTSCPTSRTSTSLFSIVSTGKDLEQVYFGKNSVTGHGGKLPKIFVDCSTISVEESAAIRERAAAARQRVRRGAGVRQCQGDQGRPALGRRFRHRGAPARRSRRCWR